MVLFNYSARELTAKIVYYGPGLGGKTTNLQIIYNSLPQSVKGKMLSLSTKTDRTLFFDFLPLDLGEIAGMKTRIQLYTVPGQVFYNETRRLVLKGSDGIVFVADSQAHLLNANIESFKNLEDNLHSHGMSLKDMPHVLQFNKRDLPSLSTIEEMNLAINKYNAPFYEAVATSGIGIQDTLRAITKLVLIHLSKKFDLRMPEQLEKGEKKEKKEKVSAPVEVAPKKKVKEPSREPPMKARVVKDQPIGSTPSRREDEKISSLKEHSMSPGFDKAARDTEEDAKQKNVDQIPSVAAPGADKAVKGREETTSMDLESQKPSIGEEDSQEIEIDLSQEVEELEADEKVSRRQQEAPLEQGKRNEVTLSDFSESLSKGRSEIPPLEIIEEKEQRKAPEIVEETVEFELKEEPEATVTPAQPKGIEAITISPESSHEVRIPFVLDVGKEKKHFQLKISFKFEEEK